MHLERLFAHHVRFGVEPVRVTLDPQQERQRDVSPRHDVLLAGSDAVVLDPTFVQERATRHTFYRDPVEALTVSVREPPQGFGFGFLIVVEETAEEMERPPFRGPAGLGVYQPPRS